MPSKRTLDNLTITHEDDYIGGQTAALIPATDTSRLAVHSRKEN